MRRVVRCLLMAVMLPGLSALPAAATGSAVEHTGSASAERGAREVVARTGKLTTRPAGLPVAGSAAAQRLKSATVRQDIEDWRLAASIELRAAPGPGSRLLVGFGVVDDGTCVSEATYATPTIGAPAAGFTVSGSTVKLDVETVEARTAEWDCAFVATDGDGEPTYDALLGELKDVHGKARLKVGKVTVLEKPQRRLGLVPGVWTPIEVAVANTSRFEARKVVVGGGGTGVRVRPGKVGWMNRDSTTTVRMQVKLTGRSGRVKLTARGPGATAGSRSIAASRVKAPRRPVAGSYRAPARDSTGTLRFRIQSGTVVGFRGEGLRMTCQAPGEVATYRTVDLTYPRKVPVPRHGIVDAHHRWRDGSAWYRVWVRMRIDGAKVTQASFTYVTADWCRVNVDFAPRR